MTRTWRMREPAGLLDDSGTAAVPWTALRAPENESAGDLWVELPTTRWGVAHPALAARANFEYLEASFPFVQRVVANEAKWRMLICRFADMPRLGPAIDVLNAGGVLSEDGVTRLVGALARRRAQEVEIPQLSEELSDLLEREGASAAAAAVREDLYEEAVLAAYLALAAESPPLPRVDAVHAEFPAHDVVVDRLVSAVTRRPELVTSREPMAGAPSWSEYERWLGIR